MTAAPDLSRWQIETHGRHAYLYHHGQLVVSDTSVDLAVSRVEDATGVPLTTYNLEPERVPSNCSLLGLRSATVEDGRVDFDMLTQMAGVTPDRRDDFASWVDGPDWLWTRREARDLVRAWCDKQRASVGGGIR